MRETDTPHASEQTAGNSIDRLGCLVGLSPLLLIIVAVAVYAVFGRANEPWGGRRYNTILRGQALVGYLEEGVRASREKGIAIDRGLVCRILRCTPYGEALGGEVVDCWGTRMQAIVEDDGGGFLIQVRSAGADRKMNTVDDVWFKKQIDASGLGRYIIRARISGGHFGWNPQ